MQYLPDKNLTSAYDDAKAAARKQRLQYDEFERLANNEVRTDLPANMPKVNDGSLASTIKKIPKRIFSKPMTGTFKSTDRDEDWIAELVSIIWERKIIPNATTDASFLKKWKVALRNSKIYGGQPIYTFFTSHGNYMGADMSLPYVKNVYLEPGKVSDLASDFIFMDSYYTKLQLKRMIERVAEEMQQAEGGGYDYEGIWDLALLKEVYDAGPGGKDPQSFNSVERMGQNEAANGLFKLVTCFNRGFEAPFQTFAPTISGKVVGKQTNTNPTGDVPITYLYDDTDLINPYGNGLIKTSGATQNILDNLTQTDVLATQIGAQPPLAIKGDRSQTVMKSMVWAPSQFWLLGSADVQPQINANPQFYNQLPQRFGLYKSQMQYQTGTFDNTVSAESGNPGFSKTDAGVKANANVTNADDNDTLQAVADAYTRVAKNMVNIHFNNMEGSELLKLEGDEIDRMAKTELVPTDPVTGEADTDQIELIWDNLRGSFDFDVDMESSLLKDKAQDMEQITNLIQTAIQNPNIEPMLQASGWKLDIGEAYVQTFNDLGIKNVDKILVKISPEEQAEMEQQQQMAQGMVDPATGQPIAPEMGGAEEVPPTPEEEMVEQGSETGADMAEEMPIEEPMEQEQPDVNMQLQDIQEQYNVDLDTAATILSALDHGAEPEEIPMLLNLMAGGDQ